MPFVRKRPVIPDFSGYDDKLEHKLLQQLLQDAAVRLREANLELDAAVKEHAAASEALDAFEDS